ncbi:MAG: MFS transporter [Pseudomonadota bacterium]
MSDAVPAGDPASLTPVRPAPRFATVLALLLASALTVMAGATIAPALPQIEAAFADTAGVELLTRLVLTVTAIFTVIGSPIAGLLVDKIGRKPLLLFGMILYAIAGTSGLYLDSLTGLLIGRAALGLSVACNLTAATTLFADLYAGPERAKMLGRQSAFMGAGGVVFLLLGGWLAELGWRAPFGIYVASLAVFVLILLFVDETRDRASRQPDAPKDRWPVGTVLMIMGFVLIAQIAFYLWPVQLPFFLGERFDVSGPAVGLAIGCASGTTAVTGILYRQFRERLGDFGLVALVYALLGLTNILLAHATSYLMVLPILVLGGASIGLMFPHGANWMTSVVPDGLRGQAVGLASSALFSGHFLSPVVSQPIMGRIGYGPGYQVFGIILIALGALVFLAHLWGRRRQAAQS